jgi:putative RecB family exonuclease
MWKHEIELEEKPENEYLNDPGLKLVDAYTELKEKIDTFRKEAEEKLEKIREALIAFSEKEGVQVVTGSESKISVKAYDTIKLPGKNTKERAELIDTLKKMGRLDEVSGFDTNALAKILEKKEWEMDELDQLEKFWATEKNYRLTVSKK